MDAKLMQRQALKNKNSERGLASLETVVMVFIFVTLLGFTLGFYGVTQRMILHSISSRAYGFEQIRNRANITYLRDVGPDASTYSYHITRLRYFAVRGPGTGLVFVAAKVPIVFGTASRGTASASPDAHNSSAYNDIVRTRRNERHYFDSVWVKVGHGICLTAECGD